MSFVIRDFQPDDFETLWHIDQQCFPPGISYSRPELKAYMRHRGAFTLVAITSLANAPAAGDAEPSGSKKSNVAGFIVAQGGPIGHIVTIDVIPSARRSGLGSSLLQAAEEKLLASGAGAVGLEAAVDNLAALAFYKRHGYSIVRTWPRYYSNGVDALVLKKLLTKKTA